MVDARLLATFDGRYYRVETVLPNGQRHVFAKFCDKASAEHSFYRYSLACEELHQRYDALEAAARATKAQIRSYQEI